MIAIKDLKTKYNRTYAEATNIEVNHNKVKYLEDFIRLDDSYLYEETLLNSTEATRVFIDKCLEKISSKLLAELNQKLSEENITINLDFIISFLKEHESELLEKYTCSEASLITLKCLHFDAVYQDISFNTNKNIDRVSEDLFTWILEKIPEKLAEDKDQYEKILKLIEVAKLDYKKIKTKTDKTRLIAKIYQAIREHYPNCSQTHTFSKEKIRYLVEKAN